MKQTVRFSKDFSGKWVDHSYEIPVSHNGFHLKTVPNTVTGLITKRVVDYSAIINDLDQNGNVLIELFVVANPLSRAERDLKISERRVNWKVFELFPNLDQLLLMENLI